MKPTHQNLCTPLPTMKSEVGGFVKGDKCFLFSSFSIDPALFLQLPIQLYPGIYLALTPQHALARGGRKGASEREHIALAGWVYPGYGLGLGIVNACIKIDSTVPAELRDRYFWLMMGALFLTKPIYMHIAGSFEYGDAEDGFLGRVTNKIDHRTNICLDTFFSHTAQGTPLLQYNEEDFQQATLYFAQLFRIFRSRHTASRPYFNLKSFLEAVLWERLHYASSSFSKLFPLIDSFVGNPTHDHCKKASFRLSAFLGEIPSVVLEKPLNKEEIAFRLQSIWDLHRAPDLHGYLKEPDLPSTNAEARNPIDRPELKDLFDLMELSRISIIKMLSLGESVLQDYCQIPIPRSKYVSKDEKKEAEKLREGMSRRFFEERTHSFPNSTTAFTDFTATQSCGA